MLTRKQMDQLRVWAKDESAALQLAAFIEELTQPDQANDPPSPKSALAASLPLEILVVDDNPLNQKLLTSLLAKLGYSAEVADTGRAALESIARKPFDIIFMDIRLPDMDGAEAARRIIERLAPSARPRIIAVTAFEQEGERERCLAAGMDDFAAKPIVLDQLRVLLQTWGGRDGNKDQLRRQTQLIDRTQVHKIKQMVDDDGGTFFASLIALFEEQGAELMSDLRDGVAVQDWPSVRRAAHSLKGSSLNIGGRQIAALCRGIEACLADDEIDAIPGLMRDLETTYIATIATLKS